MGGFRVTVRIMRRFLSFWRQCAGRAAHGNSPFANDWQWLIGYPIIAAVLWVLGFSYAEFSGRIEVTLTTGLVGVIAAGFVAFLVTWAARFLWRLLNAPVLIFYEEKERADTAQDELARRVARKITLFLDGDGVRMTRTQRIFPHPIPPQPGPDTKWPQVMVQSATDMPLVGCEARLIRAERIGNDGTTTPILTEPVFCTWSNIPEGQNTCMTIPARVPQAANLFSVEDGALELQIHTRPIKIEFRDEIQNPGIYELQIAVSAQDCRTEVINTNPQ
jgi:hypothetical protein